MLNSSGKLLYVGKAKNLKNRISSYFQKQTFNAKTMALVQQIHDIHIIITRNEDEALLLENNLIKQHKPAFNVLFRDDKSYPYIFVSEGPYPRIDFHRGAKAKSGRYFGPYPSSYAVRQTISFLQRLFKIRQCTDSFFRNRTRPCIQYQIQRCTAPCVHYISEKEYKNTVDLAVMFLEGKNKEVIALLGEQMQQAADTFDYEKAANLRDQISKLRGMQAQQAIATDKGDTDIIGIHTETGECAIEIMFVRQGRLLGSHTYFPKIPEYAAPQEILPEFIPQFYLHPAHKHDVPAKIIVSETLEDARWISHSLQETLGLPVHITKARTQNDKKLIHMAQINAKTKLDSHIAMGANFKEKFKGIKQALQLENLPNLMECFDISHTQGMQTYAACVVFDSNGMRKDLYRYYKISNITKGDDYGALHQAITRRYSKQEQSTLADVIIIDGGKGQLNEAVKVFNALNLKPKALLSIAKGPGRKSGLETIFRFSYDGAVVCQFDPKSFHLLQHIRDEAHRFAITGHKAARAKKQTQSELDTIAGIGRKRKSQLLRYFGGLKGLKNATLEDISKVSGIGEALAREIYAKLHGKS